MRIGLSVVGILLILSGGIWILQGIGVLPGSLMSGQIQWAINGSIAVVIGVGLIVYANWPKKKPPAP